MTSKSSIPPRPPRRYDVVLWGATGYTGQLVAEYLASTYGVGQTLKWALAGRSREKLEKVRAALADAHPAAASLPILVGDSSDRASLDAFARETAVVLTTVGPYALYGTELVAACVDAGTDYCDITGETPFIRDMIDRHHARAQATRARIVHGCGFDSIPSDLGTLMLQQAMRERYGMRCSQVKCFQGPSRGTFSGGTFASALNVAQAATKDRRVRRVLADPYSLDPDRGERGPDGGDQLGVRWDDDLEGWTGPFPMASSNTRIVRRSNALLGYAYGRDFRYSEATALKRGPRGLVQATMLSAGVAGGFAAMAVPPVRWLARRAAPAPGEGPTHEQRENGFFVTRLYGSAEGTNGDGRTVPKLLVTVKGNRDPGYGSTSRMLAEAAVCLALDGSGIGLKGGVLTPASCMGMRLVERLRAAGLSFEATPA